MKSKLISQFSLQYTKNAFNELLKKQKQSTLWNVCHDPYINELIKNL